MPKTKALKVQVGAIASPLELRASLQTRTQRQCYMTEKAHSRSGSSRSAVRTEVQYFHMNSVADQVANAGFVFEHGRQKSTGHSQIISKRL